MLQGVAILIPKVAFAMRVDGTLADFPRPSDFAGWHVPDREEPWLVKNINTKARGRLRSIARRGDGTLAAFPRPSEYRKRRRIEVQRYSKQESS